MLGLTTSLISQETEKKLRKQKKKTRRAGRKKAIPRDIAVYLAHNLYTQTRGLKPGEADTKLVEIFCLSSTRQIQRIRNQLLKQETYNCEQLLIGGINGTPTRGMILEPGSIKYNEKGGISYINGRGWLWTEGEKKAQYNKWVVNPTSTKKG